MNIADVLMLLHPEEMRTMKIMLQDNGEGIFIAKWDMDGRPQPTVEELQAKIPDLEVAHHNRLASLQRSREYPKAEELALALWKKEVEGDPSALERLQAQREAIKAKYPKLEEK